MESKITDSIYVGIGYRHITKPDDYGVIESKEKAVGKQSGTSHEEGVQGCRNIHRRGRNRIFAYFQENVRYQVLL